MKPVLHIIAQCTDRKRRPVAPHLRLRDVRQKTLKSRAAIWAMRVNSPTDLAPARDLYGGEHWVASLDALTKARARGFDASLWVASAGLGLVAADANVPAYSATFSSEGPDSVVQSDGESSAEQRLAWWEQLRTLLGGATRPSLEQLAKKQPRARFVVIVSPAYLQAMAAELERAAEALEDPDQLAIVSGECTEVVAGPLAVHWVPSKARLHTLIGGSRIGQHARVARRLLESTRPQDLGAAALRATVTGWLDDAPEMVPLDRTPKTDAEVKKYIRASESTTWSRALREYRGAGFACEQKRFRDLFAQEKQS